MAAACCPSPRGPGPVDDLHCWANLNTFSARGGTLLFWHGVSDPWFSALDTVDYYERLTEANGGPGQVRDWSRLFLVPGALVERLRAIQAPVVRWPGGCFADSYDWSDGVGPAGDRPARTNFLAQRPRAARAAAVRPEHALVNPSPDAPGREQSFAAAVPRVVSRPRFA